LFVHIGDPSSNQATTLESQMIHMIQELFGQTVRLTFQPIMTATTPDISSNVLQRTTMPSTRFR
jgi:hypothetical protein